MSRGAPPLRPHQVLKGPRAERARTAGRVGRMALWCSLCSGLFFFFSSQVALEVLWRPGPGLEPGKGINYTPFSYSFSFPAFSSPLLSLFAFLARSFFLFLPPPLLSFPFLLSPFSLYVSLCASHLPPLTRFLLLCLFFPLLSTSLLLLASCTP